MTDRPDPDPPRPTLDDLDPESATTDRLIEIVHYYPDHGEYPTVTVLLGIAPSVRSRPGGRDHPAGYGLPIGDDHRHHRERRARSRLAGHFATFPPPLNPTR